MHFRSGKYFFILSLLLISLVAQAVKKTRILFLLDASSSMTLPWADSASRFDVASQLLLKIIDSVYAVNPEVEFAVRTYGSSHPAQEKNCTDTRLEVPFNAENITQIKTRLKYILPVGYSPIAYSLEQAAGYELSEPRKYDYSIIFITDGGESCNGDICVSYSKFIANKISVKPYVIGLDKNERLSNYYKCMGNYLDVVKEEDVPKAVSMIVDANRRIISKTKTEEPIVLTPVVDPPVERNSSETEILLPSFTLKKWESVMPAIQSFRKKPGKVTWTWTLEEEKKVVTDKMDLFVLKPFYKTKKTDGISKISSKTFKFKKGSAYLHFQIEEELSRDHSGLITMFLPELPLKKVTVTKLKANSVSVAKKLKVYLKYEEELVRDSFQSSRLVTAEFPLKKTTVSKLMARSIPPIKKLKVYLNYEEELIRDSFEFKRLILTEFPLKKMVTTKLKASPQSVTKKLTLHLFIEDPIVRTEVPLLDMNPVKPKPVDKISALKASAYSIKKKSARLNFMFPIDRDSLILTALQLKTLALKKSETIAAIPAKASSIKNKKATLSFTIEVPKKDTLYIVKPVSYPKRLSYALSLPSTLPLRSKPKATLHFTFEVPAVASKVKPAVKKGDMDFTIKTEASNETTVQIFLIGEDGTMYPDATPRIEMVDTLTKDTLRFAREVVGGAPKKEKIKAGVYDIFIREYNVARSYAVEIVPNSNNKVTLNLQKGSLYFGYSNNIRKKVNYHAVVKKRFEEKLVVRQSCSEVLKYNPGTYYVTITDMLPPFVADVYIDFFVDYLISIPEPGQVQFSNTNSLGKVILQTPLGDGFANFYEQPITGNPEQQLLTLRQGTYRAVIPVDPNMPALGTKTVMFKVESAKTTTLELK